MTPNEVAAAARAKIAGNPDLEREIRAEWAAVEGLISDHAAGSKKKWKVYEVHHLNQAARLAMLTAFVDGKSPRESAVAGLAKTGIDWPESAAAEGR
ncbi:MAG: hypothetical protein AB7I52_17445 [Rhizobiaceae bacterium]